MVSFFLQKVASTTARTSNAHKVWNVSRLNQVTNASVSHRVPSPMPRLPSVGLMVLTTAAPANCIAQLVSLNGKSPLPTAMECAVNHIFYQWRVYLWNEGCGEPLCNIGKKI